MKKAMPKARRNNKREESRIGDASNKFMRDKRDTLAVSAPLQKRLLTKLNIYSTISFADDGLFTINK